MTNSASNLVFYGDIPCHEEPLQTLYDIIAEGEEIDLSQEVSLIFCNEQMIQQLNGDYREKDSVTDVLSFPFNDDDFLGEIYICIERMEEQAKEYNFSVEEECSRLMTHGIFHLLGYDHIEDEEAETMELLEIEILKTLNIKNPYEDERFMA